MKNIVLLSEMILTWMLPGVRKSNGNIRMKLLGFDAGFYWPCPDWSWSIHLMFWGYGFQWYFKPWEFRWVHEYLQDYWLSYSGVKWGKVIKWIIRLIKHIGTAILGAGETESRGGKSYIYDEEDNDKEH